ncbi:hypothetical protein PF008_g1626 [Phytophthora fragariae]|uniref:Myb-like domain-containing protein n=1 Tax=Phytophthora fragariae TaxID=53985 RepID=A0A6G0SJP9_9STRA|nr:hypothetical protein PF008_g1626 [Phytophthora fragariae]
MVDGKRKNFTDADDALLLKQIIADEPYTGGYGKVMERWQEVADTLNASGEFSRDNLTAKTAQNRFNLLLATTKRRLVDEHRHTQANAKEETRTKALADEKAGVVVRELAIQRLNRRNPSGDEDTLKSSQSPNKFAELAEVLREHKEKELELRREQWEQERHDRLAAEAQRREDQQRLMQVLTWLVEKK